jgi:competence protein ComEC
VTPLLAATLAYAAGLLAGLRWLPAAWLCGGLAVLAVAALRAAAVTPRAALVVAFCAAGAVVGTVRGTAVLRDCRSTWPDGARLVVKGAPAALPTPGAALAFRAGSAAADGRPCGAPVVRLRAGERHVATLDSAARGTVPLLEVHGRWLAYPVRGGWPRSPLYAGSIVVDSLGHAGSMAADPLGHAGASAADSTGPAAGARAGIVTRFRATQQARLRGLLPGRWAMAEALLLAQKAGLAQETRARFVAAGLVHLLAISGMHVGLIAAGVLLLSAAAGLPPRPGRRLALLLTAAYVLFLGAPSAALRALLQAALLLGAAELQRPADPFTVLAAAALGILIADPMALLDPGFQLSFAGMVGLIGWRRPVGDLLPRRWPRYVRDGIAAGVAASALTTPVAALHFGQASWIGIPGSLVAVPLLSAAVAGILVALLVAALTGSVTGPHALLADLPLRLLDLTAEACARVPRGHGYISAATVLGLLAAAAAFVIARRFWLRGEHGALPPSSSAPAAVHAQWAARGRRRALRLVGAAASAAAVAAWAPIIVRGADGALEIHAIDVGQGDAFAIRTPRGRWVLVDAGPRTPRSDAGRDRVVPFLLQRGARRIDALILTHPDADHIGGAGAVMDAFRVDLVIDPGLPAGKETFIDLLAAARGASTRWIAGRAGMTFRIDGVHFALLYPLHELDGPVVANDFSLVFRLEYGGFAALFLGDAPTAVEEQLVARHGRRLRAAVLKVGHHGSATSTGTMLLDAAQPELALVSAGRRNRYGHPAPSVVRRLEQHRVRVLRTDQLGNITVRATRTGRFEALARQGSRDH